MIRIISLLLLCALVSSCKVRIVVPEGGSVKSSSGAYNCASGKTCNIDVVDIFFDETFTAVPASGYTFKSWKKRRKGFCGGKSKPCHLYTSGFAGNNPLMAFLESKEVFYLQPRFEKTSSSSCSLYAGNSGYCAEGTFPTCEPPRNQMLQILNGMTYEEVVKIAGCHPSLSALGSGAAVYVWGPNEFWVYSTVAFGNQSGGTPTVMQVGL